MSTERPDNDATPPVEGPAEGPAEDTEPGGPRARRSPVVIASVAAAVLLVGGGGAYFAATASGGGSGQGSGAPGGDGTPPPLTLDGYSEGATSGSGSDGGTNGIAPGEPNPYGVTYRADGELPDGPDSSPVYWAKGEVTGAEVARLAKALGLKGTPRLAGDVWKVGVTKDAGEPHLQVNRAAPGTWTYSSFVPGTDNCPKGRRCVPVGSAGLAGMRPGAVSEEEAKKAAALVLKAVGQDDAKLDATQLMNDDQVRVVNADPKVGGLPTYGWATGLQIGSEGTVVSGSGQLKAPVKGDTYPVLGAQKTLDLMNGGSAAAPGGGRKGIGGCASPVPLKDRDEKPCEHATTLPATQTTTVEKAVFGLAARVADGRQALVPSWLFEVRTQGAEDAFTVTHPAVEPRYLTSPAPSGGPTGQPSPAPTPRGDGPTSAPAARDVKVEGYTVDGKDLTVSFTGGVCADYAVSASESSSKVTVKVTETPWKGKVCILIAKIYQKTVRLDAPLGDREVVGTDGKRVPEGKVTVPEVSGAGSAGPR
ncbi:hypothetical protein BKI49_09420 [Streptomyces sp. Tue6028]|uniref:hypothetical protein n=1 Tax=Streptomyces sp. Tue6028 TaxID=2036037 RepID=UPI000BB32696|nr:hypothetical protein [Streptomyces sp. Tue6028]PBC63920.1 hypothetical protein BKI49_09420 [Streptomyces sp. Tue6028]